MEKSKIRRNWLMTVSKISFFLLAFLLVIFTVMANMGGNSDTLKQAIEDYLASATGYEVKAGTLNKMTFFPSISVDVEKIQMFEPGSDLAPAVTIGRLYGSIGFASVAFSKGELKAFDIEDFQARPGILNATAVSFENISILGAKESGKALLQGRGKLGTHNVSFEAEMEISGDAYMFGPDRPFKVSVGDINAQGVLSERRGRIFWQDIVVGAPQTLITGVLDFTRQGKGKLRMEGDVHFGASGVIKPNLVIERREGKRYITGTLEVSAQNMDDVKGENGVLPAYHKFKETLGYGSSGGSGEEELSIDIDLTTQSGCVHITSENIDEFVEQLPHAPQMPSAQQMARHPCSGSGT